MYWYCYPTYTPKGFFEMLNDEFRKCVAVSILPKRPPHSLWVCESGIKELTLPPRSSPLGQQMWERLTWFQNAMQSAWRKSIQSMGGLGRTTRRKSVWRRRRRCGKRSGASMTRRWEDWTGNQVIPRLWRLLYGGDGENKQHKTISIGSESLVIDWYVVCLHIICTVSFDYASWEHWSYKIALPLPVEVYTSDTSSSFINYAWLLGLGVDEAHLYTTSRFAE